MTTLPPHDWHAPIIAAICAAYKRHGSCTYIEIGVDQGHTIQTVAPHVTRGFAVDITFDRLRKPLPDNFTGYCARSDDFFRMWTSDWHTRLPGPHVIFIDADHHYEQVKRDINGALNLIPRAKGTIIVHDTLPMEEKWIPQRCEDGYLAIQDLLDEDLGEVQVLTLPIFPGLTFITGAYRPLDT